MRRAGFGIRLGAASIDAVAMYLASSLAGGAVVAYHMLSNFSGAATPGNFLVPMLAANGAVWVAYSLTEVFGTATPAKRLLKLRVATEGAEPPGYRRLLMRWLAKYSPMLLYVGVTFGTYTWALRPGGPQGRPPAWMLVVNVLFAAALLAVLGGFFAVLSKRRQALHDLLAGTAVLRPGEQPQGFAPIMPVAVPHVAATPPVAVLPPAATAATPVDGGGDGR